MADYNWFEDGCGCDSMSGNGHLLSCTDSYNSDVNNDWYRRGFGGYERKAFCRGCGVYVAARATHEQVCEHLKKLVKEYE